MNANPLPGVSRRHFLATTCLAGAAWLSPRGLFAEEGSPVNIIRGAAANAKITVQTLRGGLSALLGSGGNIVALPGSDGMLLVDAGITATKPRIVEALAGLSTDPIRHLINTHWHFDHTDGNDWLHAAGARIIAHEKTRKHLSISTRVEGWNFTFPPASSGALPTEVFKQDLTLYLNGATLLLNHYEPAHTDSDISVEFPEANVLHTGDTFWNGYYPFIDYSTGGNIAGTIHAAEANVARVNDQTILVPGHGPVGDVKWGGFVIDGKTFTALVYAGV
jgi:glyoxylase-like metal-dependent hydrolase (beta-lactamase superfamily II)